MTRPHTSRGAFATFGALLSPDLIIVGGGISKESEKWVPLLTGIRARIVPATLLNDAGIVGAAMAATGIATAR